MTAANLPAPLSGPDCDLRGMPYMPVDLVRLFDSDLFALSTGEEFKAAFALWGKAFLQVPAGSIPSDDRILAHLSGAGRRWKAVRTMALRGWVLCSDGRYYHPVVSEKAQEAWKGRVSQRSRTEAARNARAAHRVAHDRGHAQSVTTSVTDTVTGSKGEGECKLKEEEDSEPLRVSATAAAAAPKTPSNQTAMILALTGTAPPGAPDDLAPEDDVARLRRQVWNEGRAIMGRLSPGTAEAQQRSLLGRWAKDCGGDLTRLVHVLRDAESARAAGKIIGDAKAWITAAIQDRPQQRQQQRPRGPVTAMERLRQMGALDRGII